MIIEKQNRDIVLVGFNESVKVFEINRTKKKYVNVCDGNFYNNAELETLEKHQKNDKKKLIKLQKKSIYITESI